MEFIIITLGSLALGSLAWTVIQIVKPELFFKAEEANTKGKRPAWYLIGGIIGLAILITLWIQAFSLQMVSVWILTGVFTLGSLKAFGIVFFYEKFSSGVTKLVSTVQKDRKAYWTMVLSRAALCIVLCLATLYFAEYFGPVH
ncbi:hypothetical protein [Perlabentimonas gracilis]|uniref:hypothetical protein n=1 Tax=Perlabentimonas gracilis TaxID=2715279 RepID=UPI00140B3D09|nr:hypothetical protein [Perlabentimonas gracilis]NHB67169.1 hypothetical protein [Perlabentimonas gracilis]